MPLTPSYLHDLKRDVSPVSQKKMRMRIWRLNDWREKSDRRKRGVARAGGKQEVDNGMQPSIHRCCCTQWRLSDHKGRVLAEMEQQREN